VTGPDRRLEPLTPTTTRQLLDEYGLAPRRADGQTFLVDANVVDRIIATADLPPGSPVLEIGPGLGALTRGLLRAGHTVVAVEIDAGFVRMLADTLGDVPALRVLHADAMGVDPDELFTDAVPEGGPVPVVANLPYNVATPLLFHLLAASRVGDLLLMVQAEVGERWVARPGDSPYGAVSLKLALLAVAELAFRVPPTVFVPVPRVDSAMVRIRRVADAPVGDDRDRLLALVDDCFTQPRKTLRNNLLAGRPGVEVDEALAAVGLDPAIRPGRLTTADVLALDGTLAGG
jgi:16S rRNA (adenine1518-N6/adenine1519-N6)-dimethyltransferase